jgi:PAS domain S-box-containing protein
MRYGGIYTVALLLLTGGLFSAYQAGLQADLRVRSELVGRAEQIARTLPPDEIRQLSFSADDCTNPAFLRLSNHLRAVAESTGLRSLYTLVLRDGQLLFGPESLLPNDSLASPPGTIYQQPTPLDFEVLRQGKPQVQGPMTDEYGTFVRALCPVIDPKNGEIVLAVGLDVEVKIWQAAVRRAQSRPLLVTAGLLAALAIGHLITAWRNRRPPSTTGWRYMEAALCAVLLLALTATVASFMNSAEEVARHDAFQALARAQAAAFTETFADYRNELHAAAQFMEASEIVTHDEFHKFAQRITTDNPVRSCGWIPQIPAEEVAAFEKSANTNGGHFKNFRIRPIGDATTTDPASMRYPLLYVEPFEGHESAIGLDLGSEPTRRAAIEEALRTGLITASEPVRLEALPGKPHGLMIFKAVRAQQQTGALQLAVVPDDMLRHILHLSGGQQAGLCISFCQLERGHEPSCLAQAGSDCQPIVQPSKETALREIIPLFAFGRSYGLNIRPTAQWLKAHPLNSGRYTVLSGLLITLLFSTLVHLLANRPLLLERMVKERSAELEETKERLEIAADAARIGVWEYSPSTSQLIWDRHMYDLYGSNRHAFKSTYRDWLRQVLPEDAPAAETAVRQAVEKEAPLEMTFRIRKPDGAIRHIRCFGRTVSGRDGTLRMIGINQDVTEQREAHRLVQAGREQLHTTLSSIGDAVISTDAQGCIALMNPVAEQLTGWNLDDAAGRPLGDIFRIINEMTGQPAESPAERVIATGQIVSLANHTLLISKDGKEIPIADSGAPIRDHNGQVTGVVLVFRDQTRERDIHRSLEESENRFRQLFNNMTAGFALHEIVYDEHRRPIDYRFLTINPAFEQLTGLKAADLIGKTVLEVMPSTEPIWIERYAQVAHTGQAIEFEDFAKELGRHYNVKAFSPDLGRFATVFTDITRQKQAEAELKEREEQYRILVENQADLLVKVDPEGKFLFVSPSYCALFGKSEEELLGQTFFPFIHEEDRPASTAAFLATQHPPFTSYMEQRAHTCEGWRWLAWKDSAVFDAEGRVAAIIGVGRDITRQKEAEEESRETRRKFFTLLSNLPGMAYRCQNTPDWRMEFVSKGCLELTGYASEDLVENRSVAFADLIHPEDQLAVWEAIQKAVRQHRPFEVEYRIRTRNGEEKRVWERGEAQFETSGQLLCLEGFITDITARKKAEIALQEHNQELERFNKASVGRELRMMELKVEINRLCQELNRPEPYAVACEKEPPAAQLKASGWLSRLKGRTRL